ncbi:transposase [Catenulispora sp. MAP5-51]|uniref:IS66 family transposase n=1 Tax=Catenulispora sp. MAP5-51 TaxID=3156298 RepID=UPI0035145033
MLSRLESLSREDLLALLALQQRQIEDLKSTVVALTDKVRDLESRLGRNSGNSSMPPSSDIFVKPERRKKPSSGRPRGKEPGAPGMSLKLVERPDQQLDEFPPECGGCRSALPKASVGFTRRQCHDILPISVQITETRWHRVRCGCGQVTAAKVPDDVPDCPYYGPQLATLAVYLLAYQHVPVERAAKLIRDVTGAAPSTGWIASQLVKVAGLVEAPNKLIMALLILASVLHADETATNVAGKKSWLHVACTNKLTLLTLAPRSKAGAAAGGVLPNFTGTMVHDALWLYRGFPDADHQLCCAHVIRELTACDERFPGQIWAPQIRWSLAEMIKVADAARSEGLDHIPPERLRRWLIYYNSAIQVGLHHHPVNPQSDKQSMETNLLLRLRDYKDQYLRFTVDLAVPATNNAAERDLRPVKTQLKISGCHASATGAKNWLAVRSYIVTAIKHGLGAFDAIRQAITGQPWMPSIEFA